MRILNILIILGCLVGGYWLVSSIMGPGIDTRPQRRDGAKPGEGDVEVAPNPHQHDWHLILDIPANADRGEIERAYRRRLAKAENSGDPFEAQRIRRAYEAATRRKA
jgi:hypothetical protein